ncbi:MAG: cold shock domain-containing protein [Acidimicrobiales bacterium]
MGELTGSVTGFDDAAGLGVVTTEDEVDYPFHCTQIADGTRSIAVGTAVSFELEPRLGRWEAVGLEPS